MENTLEYCKTRTWVIRCKSKKRCPTCLFRNDTEFGRICNLDSKFRGGQITITAVQDKKIADN